MNSPSLQELLDEARNGDRPALNALVAYCYASVRELFRRHAHDQDVAGDLTQDLFFAFCRQEAFLRIPHAGQLRVWFRTAVWNIWRSYVADPRRRGRSLGEAACAEIVASALEPSKQAEVEDLAAHLRAKIEALPDPFRAAMKLRAIEELPYCEIARKLDVPDGTARFWVCHARAMLVASIEASSSPELRAWINSMGGA